MELQSCLNLYLYESINKILNPKLVVILLLSLQGSDHRRRKSAAVMVHISMYRESSWNQACALISYLV